MKKSFGLVLLILGIETGIFAQQPDTLQRLDSLDMMIGQMILVGMGDFSVLDTSDPVFLAIAQGKVGGTILFEKNIAKTRSRKRLQEMVQYAQSQSPIPLFISIDEEGGKVNRLKTKYGFPKTATAQYLGELNNLDTTKHYALQTAQTLKELGINLNFAPALDVNVNPQNPVIGKIGRSYSPDHKQVVKHANAVIQMHDSLHVATALKHFPGHGSSRHDTHLGMADVSNTWRLHEIYPYKSLIDSGMVRMIMTAHIINAIIDQDKLPGTLSGKIVNDLLRGFLEYDGVVISDDMQMGAIQEHYGVEEAIERSINAGVDIVMYANNVPNAQKIDAIKLHQIIKGLVLADRISVDRISQSYLRIMELKRSMGFLDKTAD